jgi:hypothetical protein
MQGKGLALIHVAFLWTSTAAGEPKTDRFLAQHPSHVTYQPLLYSGDPQIATLDPKFRTESAFVSIDWPNAENSPSADILQPQITPEATKIPQLGLGQAPILYSQIHGYPIETRQAPVGVSMVAPMRDAGPANWDRGVGKDAADRFVGGAESGNPERGTGGRQVVGPEQIATLSGGWSTTTPTAQQVQQINYQSIGIVSSLPANPQTPLLQSPFNSPGGNDPGDAWRRYGDPGSTSWGTRISEAATNGKADPNTFCKGKTGFKPDPTNVHCWYVCFFGTGIFSCCPNILCYSPGLFTGSCVVCTSFCTAYLPCQALCLMPWLLCALPCNILWPCHYGLHATCLVAIFCQLWPA